MTMKLKIIGLIVKYSASRKKNEIKCFFIDSIAELLIRRGCEKNSDTVAKKMKIIDCIIKYNASRKKKSASLKKDEA